MLAIANAYLINLPKLYAVCIEEMNITPSLPVIFASAKSKQRVAETNACLQHAKTLKGKFTINHQKQNILITKPYLHIDEVITAESTISEAAKNF
tara:strand:- start:166 stop:450 length:285 start_codon:yes stop_codon:yes gene_type:complete